MNVDCIVCFFVGVKVNIKVFRKFSLGYVLLD